MAMAKRLAESTLPAQAHGPFVAPAEERMAISAVDRFLHKQEEAPVRLIGRDGEEVGLPAAARLVLGEAIHALAAGNAVAIVPVQQELTTQEAADLLNVSRQYLVRLLEEGAMPFHRAGTHRRIRLRDLLAYKAARDANRRAGLRQLTQLSEELGLYDE
jgi:excisionase family DNA binding protein